jgi:acyl-CoA synthetase (AMP-forming)/AMP-acid ligase II
MVLQIDSHSGADAALIYASATEATVWTYGELVSRVRDVANGLCEKFPPGLVFLEATNTPGTICCLLALLEARFPVCLLEPQPEGPSDRLLDAYDPEFLIREGALRKREFTDVGELSHTGLRLLRRPPHLCAGLNEQLALLLTTSGSTGNPKLVRLSLRNLESNAASIREYLRLGPEDKAVASLPIHYSYGLSVVTSHLLAGAAVVLTPHSFLQAEFWNVFRAQSCSSFAGVPFMYETLQRLRFQPSKYPSLTVMTQAGGRLKPEIIEHFHTLCRNSGRKFFVMYGQTEATARISYVPPEQLEGKIGSIGIAVPGGKLSLMSVEDASDIEEIVYSGPNVMLGYAEDRASLSQGDQMGGTLRTGDIGTRDADGFFRITGRLKRFAKLYGSRVSLDDVEAMAESLAVRSASAVEIDGRVHIFVEGPDAELGEMRSQLARQLGVPPDGIRIRTVAVLPVTSSGKKDYHSLMTL